MDRTRTLGLLAAFAVVGVLGFALGMTGILPGGPPVDGGGPIATPTPSPTPSPTPTLTATPTETPGGRNPAGLLPLWAKSYDGTCAGCHMATGGGSLHEPPFHPVGLSAQGNQHWFWDHNRQAGPSLSMANAQVAGIKPLGRTVYCSDCHSVSNPSGFANASASGRTLDPHAVHENTVRREGCDRCHDGSATNATLGINYPISMVRDFDGDHLASRQEATYGPNGSRTGSGWAKYGIAESPAISPKSCGDCHGQYHLATMGFSYTNETSVGPAVYASGGVGVEIKNTKVQCKACHTTNVHAVHTNGQMNYQPTTNLSQVQGAESCLECHGVGIARRNGGHYTGRGASQLGLLGKFDGEPDAVGYKVKDGDCGFCHESNAD